jgi:predicted HicB family RNase H-like nuclease
MLKSATLNIRINPDVKKRAQRAAEGDRRSLASLVEKLLDDYASEFEKREGKRK